MFWQGRERLAKSALVLFPSPVERAACAAHREEPLLHGDRPVARTAQGCCCIVQNQFLRHDNRAQHKSDHGERAGEPERRA